MTRHIKGAGEVDWAASGRRRRKRASPKAGAQRRPKYIIGIDEVGRGSLAGPVAVSAVCVPRAFRVAARERKIGTLRDSKKLSAAQRERWFEYFCSHKKIKYAVAQVHSKAIDAINISRAANRAAGRAFKLLRARHGIDVKKCAVFLDGGLYLNSKKASIEEYGARTIIKGDEKIIAVKIASIIAKVVRDRGMKKLSKKFPRYSFEIHKGYGTKRHIAAIKRFGPSPVHRLTFLQKVKLKKRE